MVAIILEISIVSGNSFLEHGTRFIRNNLEKWSLFIAATEVLSPVVVVFESRRRITTTTPTHTPK